MPIDPQLFNAMVILGAASISVYALLAKGAVSFQRLAKVFGLGLAIATFGLVLGVIKGQQLDDMFALQYSAIGTRFFSFGLGIILAATASLVVFLLRKARQP